MSYSANLPGYEVSERDELQPWDLQVSPPYEALHDEPKAQLTQAIECINKLLDSGVLGGDGTKVNIGIYGHANRDYENGQEASPNSVTIQVNAIREVAEEVVIRDGAGRKV